MGDRLPLPAVARTLLPVALCVLTLLPHGLLGKDNAGSSALLQRVKRGWVWNQFFVLEEYTGLEPLYIGKLHSDMDKGDGSIKYILSGEGAGSTFTIDDSTGDIHAIQRLDREVKAQYALRAQARSRLTDRPLEPESEFIVKIQDINDNEPRFLDGPYQATVPEMSQIGTSVIQLTATDADDPTYGNSARVVYSILEGQPYFSVDAKTGVVRVSLADMDRETREQYHVVIQAKDMGGQLGGLAGTTTVNITLSDVNDNPPMFDQRLYQMSVPESAPVGSVVGRIWAKDRDTGVNAEMKYSIIDGDGRDTFDISTDPTNLFGIITVKKPLDFETKPSYTLKVEGANTNLDPALRHRGPFKDVTIVHVSVEDADEPPLFDLPSYFVELPEDADIGTLVKTVSARDPDAANNTVRYSIERSTDPDKFFYMDITSGSLMTGRSLDREDIGCHNITVLAMEMNNPTQISSVSVTVKVLDVNDNPPLLTHYLEAYVCENAKAGQLIQTVTALDPDEPLSGHHFYYSLAPEAANNPNFTLRDNQDNTAWILTRRGGWSQQDQTLFYLPIFISDGEQPVQTSTSTLTIRVCSCDQEGNVMSCNAEAYSLPASLSRGALIAILACIFVLLVMILLMLSLRTHRKKPFLCDEEENVHENIVRYDDEGGGEEDTEAFDIGAMWNPREAHNHLGKMRQDMLPEIESLSRYVPQACVIGGGSGDSNVQGYVLAKLLEADVDPCAPPYDSLQTYAYEGEGSVAESLSSLQSGASNTDHEYDYLNDWGPRFKKLAEMYGVLETNPPPLW
ncbi:cadherin-20-like [Hippoglossus hippoglossus]|uniref:cadherin-20-like n=1 Tax=Hippoglossus hippoglossus TaxID=8267 RepID=UPI00148C5BA3|nr:cadherin-20-like [Hippoglossus hippoglossus]XP_034428129.1 cadherin-20-like [Hippoglossus hippoglossus]XP_034998901.1 cadherin-20 [Hippoglossus stenolepis]XP_034998902.1 cadherin-20 [Hippoglossus stenolepis]XP_034998903.1 cadherin-20 [Hippoglossus stenolepis]